MPVAGSSSLWKDILFFIIISSVFLDIDNFMAVTNMPHLDVRKFKIAEFSQKF
jgi:hypothetical protein